MRIAAAQAQIASFQTALTAYHMDTSYYPSSEEGLDALRRDPGRTGWDGPYLLQDVPLDPWGHPYRYFCPDEHGPVPGIVSDGPPRIESWNLIRR
jgi:general secretion pathway protein G